VGQGNQNKQKEVLGFATGSHMTLEISQTSKMYSTKSGCEASEIQSKSGRVLLLETKKTKVAPLGYTGRR